MAISIFNKQQKKLTNKQTHIMKKLTIILLFISSFILLNAQNTKIEIGIIDTISSKILSEKRPIWIYKPNNETGPAEKNKKYPVVYLLDGDWHFISVVGMLQQLGYINGNTVTPEMIVVGIPVSDRYRDMTSSCDTMVSKNSGGYENFISFIKNELFPHIESTLPVSPYKVLIGHSLGGLTAINTLIRYPDLFNSYIAIDPSMWWNNQYSLKEAASALSGKTFEYKKLFVALANTMEKNMDTSRVRKDNSRNTLPIRSLLEFSDLLKSSNRNKLEYQIKYYLNENHGSVPHIATYDGLHFIFDFYNLSVKKSDYLDTTMALADKVEKHYKLVSQKMGYLIKPSENTINAYGYSSIYMNNLKLARYFFDLNIKYYPESYNVYDSSGDFYVMIQNYKQAALMYQKALTIFEDPGIRKKLEEIKDK